MAKVLLLTQSAENPADNSYLRGPYTRLKQSAGMGRSRHTLVTDPNEADIILCAEIFVIFAYNIRHHRYYKPYRDKCFVFAQDDNVIPMLPGVYASQEKRWYSSRRARAGLYLSVSENPYTEFDPAPVERDLLYSFVGSVKTSPTRAVLATLNHPRGFFTDTSKESLPILRSGATETRDAFWKNYADIARRSKFVLCPRGEGTSSIRLFEMMRMGRAPVILSDEWVSPEGPQWEQFSIRIPERDAMKVPQILEERESEAVALGLKAREEWERWFAPEVVFDTVVDWCMEIKNARRLPEYFARMTVYPQILRPIYFRAYLRLCWAVLTGKRKPPKEVTL